MASKKEGQKGKKRQKIDDSSDDSSSYESDSEELASNESFDENMEIPVEFEAFPPDRCDFKAMRNLLKQLFLKNSVDLSELADVIISQKEIGSIIKVVDDDDEDEYNEKEVQKEENGACTSTDEDYEEEILGLITLLDLVKYKDKKCIQQIKNILLEKCKTFSNEKTYAGFKEIICNDEDIGLLLSERFINIPPQVALPLYKALSTELQHHYKQVKNTSLKYILLISKSFREKDENKSVNSSSKKGKKLAKKVKKGEQFNFSNVEDEILFKKSLMTFSYPADIDNNDTLIGGKWGFEDKVLLPYRTVMVVPYKHLNSIIEQMETLLVS